MKCLSIQAPWAWFILLGLKPVENRTWASGYRGPLMIHVGKKYDHGAMMYLCSNPVFKGDVNQYLNYCNGQERRLPLGVIAGKVEMVDCVTTHESPWFFGPYGFAFKDPKIIQPIPYKGQLGIFEVPDEILLRLEKQREAENALWPEIQGVGQRDKK